MAPIIAAERIWITRDGAGAVGEGHPDAGSLLAAVGHPVTAEDAKRYGIGPDGMIAKAEKGPEKKPETAPSAKAEGKAGTKAEKGPKAKAEAK